MKTQEFRQSYAIDRTANTIRATPRTTPPELPPVMTGDGTPYDASLNYYFYDPRGQIVQESTGLGLRRTVDGWLASMGLKFVEISRLRANRDDALKDAQDYLHAEIAGLRQKIADFEMQKTPTARSLKTLLDSRNVESGESDFLG